MVLALVPPFSTGSMPVTSLVRSTSAPSTAAIVTVSVVPSPVMVIPAPLARDRVSVVLFVIGEVLVGVVIVAKVLVLLLVVSGLYI